MDRPLKRLPLLARLVTIVTLVPLGACASGGPAGADAGGDAGDARLITRAEIDRGQWKNTYDLVSSLRPRWVRARGIDSFEDPGQVQVYVDGTRLGDVVLLRTLPTTGIQRLEWVDPVNAAGRWGMDHGHGVISIIYGSSHAPPQP
jgi:hypothetical protein